MKKTICIFLVFCGAFCPSLKNPNPWARRIGVAISKDETQLAEVVVEDENAGVRFAASARLTKAEALMRAASRGKDREICMAALEKLDDQDLIAKVAVTASDIEVQRVAVSRLTKQEVLTDIAIKNPDVSVCRVAAEKVIEPKTLAKIASEAPNPEIRRTAFNMISDEKTFEELAESCRANDIRRSAVAKTVNQAVLAQVAENDSDLDVIHEAYGRLSSESYIIQVALSSPHHIAIRLANQVDAWREEALKRVQLSDLRDPVLLERVVAVARNEQVRSAALRTLKEIRLAQAKENRRMMDAGSEPSTP